LPDNRAVCKNLKVSIHNHNGWTLVHLEFLEIIPDDFLEKRIE
jgi:hypothetical protein